MRRPRRGSRRRLKPIGVRVIGEARRGSGAARLAAYGELQPPILLGLALKELAANLPEIEHLTLAPDVLGEALAHVAGKR